MGKLRLRWRVPHRLLLLSIGKVIGLQSLLHLSVLVLKLLCFLLGLYQFLAELAVVLGLTSVGLSFTFVVNSYLNFLSFLYIAFLKFLLLIQKILWRLSILPNVVTIGSHNLNLIGF